MNNAVSTDYLEEQKNEIEALQSIYPEEFEGKKKQLFLYSFWPMLRIAISDSEFRISIYPDEQDPESPRKKMKCCLI